MDIKGKAILLGGVSAAERGGEPYVYRRRRAAALRPPGLYPRGDGDAGRAEAGSRYPDPVRCPGSERRCDALGTGPVM